MGGVRGCQSILDVCGAEGPSPPFTAHAALLPGGLTADKINILNKPVQSVGHQCCIGAYTIYQPTQS